MKLTSLTRFFLIMILTYSGSSIAQSLVSIDELIGQYNEKTHPNFVALDSTILPVNKSGMYLQKEPTEKLIEAYYDFKKQHPNIPFVVVSATRNYNYQNGIWSRKWQNLYPKFKDNQKTANSILQYSSMPGTSRHHWGTDVDITSVSSDYFRTDPKGKILYAWLLENMPKYGFCQAFNEGRKFGYQPEEWHWSYQPIASQYIQQYRQYMTEQPKMIMDKLTFIGHEKLDMPTLIEQYVFSVNSLCY